MLYAGLLSGSVSKIRSYIILYTLLDKCEYLKDLGFIKIGITPNHSKYTNFLAGLIQWQCEEKLEGRRLVRRCCNIPVIVIKVPIDSRKRKGR